MDSDIKILDRNCFVCCKILSVNFRPISEPTNHSQKPIYEFLEKFVGLKFNASVRNRASLCTVCLEELNEYERICKQATKIQEHLTGVFSETQKRLKKPDECFKCSSCLLFFDSQGEKDDHDCFANDSDASVEYVPDSEEEDTDGASLSQKRVSDYTCNICNKSFDRKRNYNQHAKLAHLPEGAKVFTCELGCDDLQQDNVFASELELKYHYVTKHPKEPGKPIQCPGCPKIFGHKNLLYKHFGLHLKDKPIICELCGKRYYHSSSFHMHMVVHSGVKNHVCVECGRSFISTSHLNRHMKTHTGVKNYECHNCGSKFAQRYNLRAHMKIHIGDGKKKKSN